MSVSKGNPFGTKIFDQFGTPRVQHTLCALTDVLPTNKSRGQSVNFGQFSSKAIRIDLS